MLAYHYDSAVSNKAIIKLC